MQYLANTIFQFRTDSNGILGIFFSFVIVGALLRKELLKGIKTQILLICGAILLVGSIIWLKAFFLRDGIQYTIWYEWAPIDLLGIIVFELFRRSHVLDRRVHAVEWMSKHGFGYFFVHGIVLNLLAAYVPMRPGSYLLATLVYWMCTLGLSTALIYLISKSSLLSRYLLAA